MDSFPFTVWIYKGRLLQLATNACVPFLKLLCMAMLSPEVVSSLQGMLLVISCELQTED